MNVYENELKKKWNSINYYTGGSLQLSVRHPLEWYVRYATPEQKSLVIVSDCPLDNIFSSKSIEASCNQRKDGKYAISFTLLDIHQEDVFITMSCDIIEFSCVEKPDVSLVKVLRRYNAWLKLLDHKHSALLGVNAQKGLIGELLFLKEQIELGMQVKDAVLGWVGPDGADQDFFFNDGWYEIKSTGISSTSLAISSVEQLDCDNAGELVVYRIDKCAPAQAGAFTLYGLVHSIFNLLQKETAVLDEFLLKLGSAGYIDMKDYDKQKFVFFSKQTYKVDDSFPRLRRDEIPIEVVRAEYHLNIPSISYWLK